MGKKVSKLSESEWRGTLKRMKTVGPVDIPVQVFGRGANLQEENAWTELWQLQTDYR